VRKFSSQIRADTGFHAWKCVKSAVQGTLQNLGTSFFLGIIAGVVSGGVPRYLHEKYTERKRVEVENERKNNIRQAIIHEITLNHKLNLFHVLEDYRENWREGPFHESYLKWVCHYPDTIYDVYSKELDLIFHELAVQIHYYYRHIKQLNTYALNGVPTKDIKYASSYLSLVRDTYSALYGVLNLLTHQPGSQEEFMMILDDAEKYLSYIDVDINIFNDYGLKGVAESLSYLKKRRNR